MPACALVLHYHYGMHFSPFCEPGSYLKFAPSRRLQSDVDCYPTQTPVAYHTYAPAGDPTRQAQALWAEQPVETWAGNQSATMLHELLSHKWESLCAHANVVVIPLEAASAAAAGSSKTTNTWPRASDLSVALTQYAQTLVERASDKVKQRTVRLVERRTDDLVLHAHEFREAVATHARSSSSRSPCVLVRHSPLHKFTVVVDLHRSSLIVGGHATHTLAEYFGRGWTRDDDARVRAQSEARRVLADMSLWTNYRNYTMPSVSPGPSLAASTNDQGAFQVPVRACDDLLWSVDILRSFQNSYLSLASATQLPADAFVRLNTTMVRAIHFPEAFVLFHSQWALERMAPRPSAVAPLERLLHRASHDLQALADGAPLDDPTRMAMSIAVAIEWLADVMAWLPRLAPYLNDTSDRCPPALVQHRLQQLQQRSAADRDMVQNLVQHRQYLSAPVAKPQQHHHHHPAVATLYRCHGHAHLPLFARGRFADLDVGAALVRRQTQDDARTLRAHTAPLSALSSAAPLAICRRMMGHDDDPRGVYSSDAEARAAFVRLVRTEAQVSAPYMEHRVAPGDYFYPLWGGRFPEMSADDCDTMFISMNIVLRQLQLMSRRLGAAVATADDSSATHPAVMGSAGKKMAFPVDHVHHATLRKHEVAKPLLLQQQPRRAHEWLWPLMRTLTDRLYVPVMITCAMLRRVNERVPLRKMAAAQLRDEAAQHARACPSCRHDTVDDDGRSPCRHAASGYNSNSRSSTSGQDPFATRLYPFRAGDPDTSTPALICHVVMVMMPRERLRMLLLRGIEYQSKVRQARSKMSAAANTTANGAGGATAASASAWSAETGVVYTNTHGCHMDSGGRSAACREKHGWHALPTFVVEGTEYSVALQDMAAAQMPECLAEHAVQDAFVSHFRQTFEHASACIIRHTRRMTRNHNLYCAAVNLHCPAADMAPEDDQGTGLGLGYSEAILMSNGRQGVSFRELVGDGWRRRRRHHSRAHVSSSSDDDDDVDKDAEHVHVDSLQSHFLALPVSGTRLLGATPVAPLQDASAAAEAAVKADATVAQLLEDVCHAEPRSPPPPVTQAWRKGTLRPDSTNSSNNNSNDGDGTFDSVDNVLARATGDVVKGDKSLDDAGSFVVRIALLDSAWKTYGSALRAWLRGNSASHTESSAPAAPAPPPRQRHRSGEGKDASGAAEHSRAHGSKDAVRWRVRKTDVRVLDAFDFCPVHEIAVHLEVVS